MISLFCAFSLNVQRYTLATLSQAAAVLHRCVTVTQRDILIECTDLLLISLCGAPDLVAVSNNEETEFKMAL